MDATQICILALADNELIVINPNMQFKGKYKDLPDKYIQKIPISKIEFFNVESDDKQGFVSWKYQGKLSKWRIPLAHPGVWKFNPDNFKKFQNLFKEITR